MLVNSSAMFTVLGFESMLRDEEKCDNSSGSDCQAYTVLNFESVLR